MKILKKLFHKHIFRTIEDIAIYEKDNPYAHLGQLEICFARQCISCAKIQVKSYGRNNNGWQEINGFISEEKSHITQNDNVALIRTIIKPGTPIVKTLTQFFKLL